MEKFEIIIDFDKTENHPERIFKCLSSIIEDLNYFDSLVCKTIPSKIKADTLLEDVEKGSIKVILKNVLESIDDEGLQNCDAKKIFGNYLCKAKYLFIKFLEEPQNLKNPDKLSSLREDIFQLSNEADNRILPVYGKINTSDLVKNIYDINTSFGMLTNKDKIKFKIEDKEITAKYNEEFCLEKFEELLTANELVTSQMLILKVKKPDYLGESKWELRHGTTPIPAKISDIDWLKKFQNREIDIRPKDSLKCEVQITTNYDEDSELISTKYIITKVYDVIPFASYAQSKII